MITELEVGGAERCLVNLATGLDRSNFEPIVCSLAPRPTQKKNGLVEQLEATSISTHFLNLRSSWQFLAARRRLKLLLRSCQPDIVQTFLYHANVLGSETPGAPR